MNAILNVYKDCSTEKPSKQYVCKRLLFGVSKKVQAVSENIANKTQEEQLEATIEVLKAIFPNFEAEDINYIDPIEYAAFIAEISSEANKVFGEAQKN